MLYLGCSVLILQELSYLSRFWRVPRCIRDTQAMHPPIHISPCALYVDACRTQFEAWCSMQSATEDGLGPAPAAERRCTVVPILQATEGMASELIMM